MAKCADALSAAGSCWSENGADGTATLTAALIKGYMAHIGHPICGDGKYAGEDAHPGGPIARRLHLRHG